MNNTATNTLLLLASSLLAYAVAELLFSYLYVHGQINPPSRDGWYFEELGNTVQFDPVIGYRLTTTPSRHLRISNGETEYSGIFVGNNAGFPDRDDFQPARVDNRTLRVAVIGDSFSSGQFLATNWPERVKELAQQQPNQSPLQLLNFSVYSGGLANWYNIVTRIIAAQDYQLDALVFPVFANDLFRPFMLFEARDQQKLLIGNAGWDPTQWPATREQAMPFLHPSDGYILSRQEWQQFEQGWHPELPRSWQPYLSQTLQYLGLYCWQQADNWLRNPQEQWAAWHASRNMTSHPEVVPEPDASLQRGRFTDQHLLLIRAIRDYARSRQLPVLVIRIPDHHEATQDWPIAGNVLEFAELLDARVIDGAAAFNALSPAEKRSHYFPVDGHWNQQGSDRFATFIYPQLQAFLHAPQQ